LNPLSASLSFCEAALLIKNHRFAGLFFKAELAPVNMLKAFLARQSILENSIKNNIG
jgi:hypothetical protein